MRGGPVVGLLVGTCGHHGIVRRRERRLLVGVSVLPDRHIFVYTCTQIR